MKPKSQTIKRIDDIEGSLGEMPSGESMVVIRNSGLPEGLNRYIEITPKEINKSVFAGSKDMIVVNGLSVYKYGSTAPNGVAIDYIMTSDASGMPDIIFYNNAAFNPSGIYNNGSIDVEIRGFNIRMDSELSGGRANYVIDYEAYSKETGEAISESYRYATTETGYFGAALVYTVIHDPYSKFEGTTGSYIAEFGYVDVALYIKRRLSGRYYFTLASGLPIPFKSMEEYNNAVILASVPQSMATLQKK